jgi:hypothetical protein
VAGPTQIIWVLSADPRRAGRAEGGWEPPRPRALPATLLEQVAEKVVPTSCPTVLSTTSLRKESVVGRPREFTQCAYFCPAVCGYTSLARDRGGGWGLGIPDPVAGRWGTMAGQPRMLVWFELPTDEDRPGAGRQPG